MKPKGIILTMVVLLGASLASYAQQITIKLDGVRLEQVLDEITSQTGYAIYHSRPSINPDEIVSLNVKDVRLEEALDALFSGKPIRYEIKNQKVYLSAAEKTMPAQTKERPRQIKGVVIDTDGLPVPGAMALIKGTTRGASTDIDGNFTIDAASDEVIEIVCLGYATQSIAVGSKTELSITLAEDSMMLDDVVVVGYGVVKKRDVSTAISSIKAEDIANLPNSDFRQAMVGKMPGVSVMQTGGDPEGSNMMVRVRGVSSVSAGNDPLYIIDGVPVENGLSNLNPNDVESMEVLKDASSAAIYGSRGSNGVIIITTKKGKTDKVSVSYDGYYGIERV